jgi:ribonuclease HI
VDKPTVRIYTDGSCAPNPGPGGWAAVLLAGGHRKELSGADRDTTNNRMELTAALEALRALRVPSVVVLHTDSQYLRNAFEKGWLSKWQRTGWRTADGKPVQNEDLWRDLVVAAKVHEVRWEWVRGHASDVENNRCDELANQARAAGRSVSRSRPDADELADPTPAAPARPAAAPAVAKAPVAKAPAAKAPARDAAPAPVSLREAEEDDARVIATFNGALALESEQHVLDADTAFKGTMAVLRDPVRGFYLVAELAGEVVGQVLVTREWSDWRNAWFWWIQSVYVRPDVRRRGVFHALYRAVEERSRKAPGVCGLRLYVATGNRSARKVYESQGMDRADYVMYEYEPYRAPSST